MSTGGFGTSIVEAGQAMAAQLQVQLLQAEVVHELEETIPGLRATAYLSAAGLIILLYDHMLLFGEEIRLIWRARMSWSKALFLIHRYTTPLLITVTAYQLSGISDGLTTNFCRTWFTLATFIGTISLGIATVFVIQRVYALWGHSKKVLAVVAPAFLLVYTTSFMSMGVAINTLIPHISYSPVVKTCVIDMRPTLYIPGYAAPIAFDVILFILTCWNALDRPRHMHTAIVKQLYFDGGVFFVALLSLRLFNIILIAVAPLPYVQLGVYFLWAMITAIINRMLITISSTLDEASQYDSCGRGAVFEHSDTLEDKWGDDASLMEEALVMKQQVWTYVL